MHTKTLANYLLSIALTLEDQSDMRYEIEFLNHVIEIENPTQPEIVKMMDILHKYDIFVKKLLSGEKNNRLAKIAIMNNICFFYYDGALKHLNAVDHNNSIKKLYEINNDIKHFNAHYYDLNFVNKIEFKYIDMIRQLIPNATQEVISG